MSDQHTPAPWIVYSGDNGIQIGPIFRGGMHPVAVASNAGLEDAANAERIVACVNFCDGCVTEDLSFATTIGGLTGRIQRGIAREDKLQAQRAALLAAAMLASIEFLGLLNRTPAIIAAHDALDAAIAKGLPQ